MGVLVLGLVPLVEEAQAADLTTKSLALRRRRGRSLVVEQTNVAIQVFLQREFLEIKFEISVVVLPFLYEKRIFNIDILVQIKL